MFLSSMGCLLARSERSPISIGDRTRKIRSGSIDASTGFSVVSIEEGDRV
ncbi:hypothetical protein [Baaleninema simplex]|nr:hypothetical protein [Baaleninema simplex]